MSEKTEVTASAEPESGAHTLEEIITHCQVLALRCDREGRFLYVNQAAEQILETPASSLLGKQVIEVLPSPPHHNPGCREALANAVTHAVRTEYRFSRLMGDLQRDYLVVLTPRADGNGEVTHLHGVGVDISSQRRKVREAREADRRKEQFLAIVAHEMRNPLSTVRSGLKVLARQSSQDQAAEVVQMMDRQIEYLARLVTDLLDVSRANQERMQVAKTPILASEIISLALETSRQSIERGAHSLKVLGPREPLRLLGDLQRLSQVVGNLLDNAAKYTPANGEVILEVRREDRHVVFIVSDNGIGIPPEEAPHIFEVFRQLDGGKSKQRGGLGIGLYLVKMIVEAHDGTIEVSSGGSGRGSAFTVRIPSEAKQL